MTKEQQAIAKVTKPIDLETLLENLKTLGIQSSDRVCVHSSLASIGWIIGKEFTLIQALQQALSEGTLIMPSHTGDNSDPKNWENPPVPKSWWPIIRKKMIPFDKQLTPTRGLSVMAERFRQWPDVLRSDHPQVSFTAWGLDAKYFVFNHALTPMFGDDSPMGKLYKLNGKILLIGVGYDSCSLLHYAEYLAQMQPKVKHGSAIVNPTGQRQWVEFLDEDYDNEDFAACGEAYERIHPVEIGFIGEAPSRLIDGQSLIDFAVDWFKYNRQGVNHA